MRNAGIAMGALVLLAVAASAGFGFEVPDRARHDTFAAESATPVEYGKIEADLSLTYQSTVDSSWTVFDNSWDQRRGERARATTGRLALAYGYAEDLEFGLALDYVDVKDRHRPFGESSARGLGNLDLSLKWRFYRNEDVGFSLAYMPELAIPVGRATKSGRLGTTTTFWAWTNRLAMTQDVEVMGTGFSLNADAAYLLPFGGTRRHYSQRFGRPVERTRGVFDTNASLAWHLHRHFRPEAGVSYAHEFVRRDSGSDLLAASAGVMVPLTQDWRVKAHYEQALIGRNAWRTRTIAVGLVVRF